MEAAELSRASVPSTQPQGLRQRLWLALSSFGAAVLGLAPHVLHHAGPLAGAALFAGVGGSLLFGALGLIAAIPFLLKVHRHCGNWRIPAATLALFATVFAVSTFVIGPAIAGGESGSQKATPAAPEQPSGHDAHH